MCPQERTMKCATFFPERGGHEGVELRTMTQRVPVCPVEVTLGVIGGRWKPVIVFHLLRGTRRYSELRRIIPGVTHKMLTEQLRELERDGILVRKVYPEVPPRVQYRLTPLGRSLSPILREMCLWAKMYNRDRPSAHPELSGAEGRPVRNTAQVPG
jgi:DNA-binding HxlR family transcriptional regulator